ncbi:hypothetical protein ACSBR2_008803 [Camellia fascicularis]
MKIVMIEVTGVGVMTVRNRWVIGGLGKTIADKGEWMGVAVEKGIARKRRGVTMERGLTGLGK